MMMMMLCLIRCDARQQWLRLHARMVALALTVLGLGLGRGLGLSAAKSICACTRACCTACIFFF